MLLASVYAIIVGVSMIGLWLMLFLTKKIPELASEPYRIGFHLAGEILTALLLILGGIGLWAGYTWGNWVYLVSLGMLFYTSIVSPGYYAQQRQWGMVVMFAVVLIFGVICLGIVI
jgi:hypothetical protein